MRCRFNEVSLMLCGVAGCVALLCFVVQLHQCSNRLVPFSPAYHLLRFILSLRLVLLSSMVRSQRHRHHLRSLVMCSRRLALSQCPESTVSSGHCLLCCLIWALLRSNAFERLQAVCTTLGTQLKICCRPAVFVLLGWLPGAFANAPLV